MGEGAIKKNKFFSYLSVFAILGQALPVSKAQAAEDIFTVTLNLAEYVLITMEDLVIDPVDLTVATPTNSYVSVNSAQLQAQSNSDSGWNVQITKTGTTTNGATGWNLLDGTETVEFSLLSDKNAAGEATAIQNTGFVENGTPTGGTLIDTDDQKVIDVTAGTDTGMRTYTIHGWIHEGELDSASEGIYTCQLKMVITNNDV